MTGRASPRHGGDLAFATALHGEPPGGWLDLSTGVNPVPYPLPFIPQSAFARLPEPGELERLLALARALYKVPAHLAIAAVPGSEAAIRLLPLAASPGSVAVIGPTYRSHGEAWRGARREVAAISSLDQALDRFSVVALANPNNPDGRRVSPARLLAVGEALGRRRGLLVVDEAFADLDPSASIVPSLGGEPVLVLRSFGKFFGLPGLRLGFVIGQPALIGRLSACFGDWPVSGPALSVSAAAMADAAWMASTRRRILADSARLQALLEGAGLQVAGNAGLFLLVEDRNAKPIHQALAAKGIWTRVFTEQPSWLRIGLANQAAFPRLESALADLQRPTP